MPKGEGPFPAVLLNHGSAGGMLNTQAFDAIAPVFVERGFAFFAPYRRGQGLSARAGPFIMDEIAAARRRGGFAEADRVLTRLLATDYFGDQLAALAWLRAQSFARADRIAAMGNSFGGVETLLGAARSGYCAGVDAAGGAESWGEAPALRALMLQAARERAGLPSELRIYAAFGWSSEEGHSFPYRGVAVWKADVLAFVERHCGG